jgi:hypothetical protein
MAEFTEILNDRHVEMIGKQPIFFVATAATDGRINLSPKGLDCFRVLGQRQVGYLDLGGSGNETHAHLAADGRITTMFCNFEQPALILRIAAGDDRCCRRTRAGPRWRRSSHCCPARARSS